MKEYGMALRSAIEVVASLHIAKRRNFINSSLFNELYTKAEEIIKMTQALRNSLKK